jgi:hypothetical protein
MKLSLESAAQGDESVNAPIKEIDGVKFKCKWWISWVNLRKMGDKRTFMYDHRTHHGFPPAHHEHTINDPHQPRQKRLDRRVGQRSSHVASL